MIRPSTRKHPGKTKSPPRSRHSENRPSPRHSQEQSARSSGTKQRNGPVEARVRRDREGVRPLAFFAFGSAPSSSRAATTAGCSPLSARQAIVSGVSWSRWLGGCARHAGHHRLRAEPRQANRATAPSARSSWRNYCQPGGNLRYRPVALLPPAGTGIARLDPASRRASLREPSSSRLGHTDASSAPRTGTR